MKSNSVILSDYSYIIRKSMKKKNNLPMNISYLQVDCSLYFSIS